MLGMPVPDRLLPRRSRVERLQRQRDFDEFPAIGGHWQLPRLSQQIRLSRWARSIWGDLSDAELDSGYRLNDLALDESAASMIFNDLYGRRSGKRMRHRMEYGKREILECLVVFQPKYRQSMIFNFSSRNVPSMTLEMFVIRKPFGNRFRHLRTVAQFFEHKCFQPCPDQFPGHIQSRLAFHQEIGAYCPSIGNQADSFAGSAHSRCARSN